MDGDDNVDRTGDGPWAVLAWGKEEELMFNFVRPRRSRTRASSAQGASSNKSSSRRAPRRCGWSDGPPVDGTLYISGMAGEDAAGKIAPDVEQDK